MRQTILGLKIICCAVYFVLLACFSGCASNGNAPVNNVWDEVNSTQTHYTVQAGDTLYTVAWRFNLTDESLASWNHLHKPYALRVGQVLRLRANPQEPAVYRSAVNTTPSHVTPTQSLPAKKTGSLQARSKSTDAEKITGDQADKTISAPKDVDAHGKGSWPWPAKGKLRGVYGQQGNKGIDIALPEGTNIKAVQAGTVVYSGSNLHGYGQLLIIKQKNNLITAYAHNSKLLVAEGDSVTAGQVIALSGSTEASAPMLHFEVRQLGKTVDPLQYLA